jgi:hypothetical protein
VRGPDGTLRSSRPLPIGGDWKSFIRVHKGRTQISAPIRMPADPAVGFAGFPAVAKVTRPMVRDTKLLQIEQGRWAAVGLDPGAVVRHGPQLGVDGGCGSSLRSRGTGRLCGRRSVRAPPGEVRRCHRPASPRARSLGDRRRERGGVMSTLVLAHIGHWTTSLAFFGPVVLLPLGLYGAAVMERRRS